MPTSESEIPQTPDARVALIRALRRKVESQEATIEKKERVIGMHEDRIETLEKYLARVNNQLDGGENE